MTPITPFAFRFIINRVLPLLVELVKCCQRFSRYVPITLALGLLSVACTPSTESVRSPVTPSPSEGVLTIWWEKGFALEEDEALQQVVSAWEQQSGYKVKLTLYPNEELPKKAQRAIQAGHLPDVLMSHAAERELNPRCAWDGQLVDVSDIIEPIRDLYPQAALDAAYLYNHADRQRRYYAVPIYQATIHIFYWQDLLRQVGRTQQDIPRNWDGFWRFWEQMQNDLQARQKPKIYGLGLPTSIASADTYQVFEQVLEAYDVQLLDKQGQLRVDQPSVRQGLVKSLDWYTQFYRRGYVPPDAAKWLSPDNNRSLLNRLVVMTPNITLSIPVTVRQDPELYQNKLGALEFPDKPSGQRMHYLVAIRQAVIFGKSRNQKMARDFLTFLMQPQIIGNYLKSSGGRNLPVLKPLWNDPFWNNSADPHRAIAAKQLLQRPTRPYAYVQNPAYSVVLSENLWGKALHRIAIDGISPEQAADESIQRIKQIFKQWPHPK